MNKGDLRILLVEDNSTDALIVKDMLKRAQVNSAYLGVHLTHVTTFTEGLEIIKTSEINVVLLDLSLPDGNGHDLLVEHQEEVKNIPVIILTGNEDQREATRALQYGAQDYLIKGYFDQFSLTRSIHYSVERKRIIAELKSKSDALFVSEERNRTIIEKSSDAIVILSLSGSILYKNPAANVLFHEKTTDEIEDLLSEKLKGKEGSEIIVKRLDKKNVGEVRVVEIHWGDQPSYLATIRDITVRKIAEQAQRDLSERLRISSRKMETLVESMLEGVVMFDARGELVILNSQAKNMLSIHENDCITTKEFNARFPSLKIGVESQECSQTPECLFMIKEITVESKENGSRFLQCEVTPVRDSEVHLGFSVVIRDITKEKETERRKSEFISLVSHELRTPLASIKNVFSILLKGSTGQISGDQERFLAMGNRNTDRLRGIIDDLLDISKIEAGKLKLNFEMMDINEPINTVLNSLEEEATAKKIVLKKDMPENTDQVYGDSDRLVQILFNLIGNAIKFTPEKGTVGITVRPKNIPQINAENNQSSLSGEFSSRKDCTDYCRKCQEVIIEDSGIGIPEKELLLIFNRFHQVADPLSRSVGGTGLGLAIVKKLVEIHHGTIRVESVLKKGSRFIITLPITPFE